MKAQWQSYSEKRARKGVAEREGSGMIVAKLKLDFEKATWAEAGRGRSEAGAKAGATREPAAGRDSARDGRGSLPVVERRHSLPQDVGSLPLGALLYRALMGEGSAL